MQFRDPTRAISDGSMRNDYALKLINMSPESRRVSIAISGLTGARLASKPRIANLGRFTQQLSRFSAAFALISDTAMGTLGGSLKRREKISGRLADALRTPRDMAGDDRRHG